MLLAEDRPADWDAIVDDAVHEINQRWGEPWGDDMLPMDQKLVRETAEAVVASLVQERDELRHLLGKLMDPRKHWAAGIYTKAKALLKDAD